MRPVSSTAKVVVYTLLIGSWFAGIAVNTLWASHQSFAAYWIASLLGGVPAMLAGWPLLIAPGWVMWWWGVTPPIDKDHPEHPPRWRFGQLLVYAVYGAIAAAWGTWIVVFTILRFLTGCVDPTLPWSACF